MHSNFISQFFGSPVFAVFFIFKSEPKLNKNFATARSFFKSHAFRLGLDLSGGSHLIYKADISQVPAGQVSDSMSALRDVIERRVNLFGVSEPVVQVQNGGFISGSTDEKLQTCDFKIKQYLL